jgi:hypothetical protein
MPRLHISTAQRSVCMRVTAACACARDGDLGCHRRTCFLAPLVGCERVRGSTVDGTEGYTMFDDVWPSDGRGCGW